MSISNFAVFSDINPPVLLRTGAVATEMVPYQAAAGERAVITATLMDPTTSKAVISDPNYNGTYLPEVFDPATGQVTTPGTIVTVVPKTTNACVVDKTTFTANGTDAVTITGIGTGAKVDIRMPSDIGIDDIIDTVVTDGVAIITTTEKGAYRIDIDDGTTTHYEVTIYAV